MADIEEGTVVESIYLENRTSRKAFYLVEIQKTTKQYQVVVKWGRLGTDGQSVVKNRCSTIDGARVKAQTLAEQKKLRSYQEAKKPKKHSKEHFAYEKIDKNDEMIRFADLE